MLKISIITVCKNSESTLESCLNTVLNQESVDFEYLIIDGGSVDNSLSIIDQYSAQISFLLSEPDNGIYDALNKGLSRATGDVIGILHSDDLLANKYVLTSVATAFDDPMVDAVYGDLIYVDKMDMDRAIRYWRAGDFFHQKLRCGWMPPHPTLYVRKRWYDRLGGFDTRYRIAGDYDYILRLFSQPNFNAVYIPEVLVKMRVGGASNRSLKQVIKKTSEDYRALRQSKLGGLMTLVCKNLRKVHQFWVR